MSHRIRSASTPLVLMALVAAVVLAADSSSSAVLKGAAVTAAISVVLAVGLYTFIGITGILSFGQMAMMMIGGYVAVIVATPVDVKRAAVAGGEEIGKMPGWIVDFHVAFAPALLIGAGVGAAFALVISIPLVRLRGLAASLATFAVLVMVNVVASNWTALTGGVSGYNLAPLETTLASALVCALIVIGIAYLFKESRIGLRLRGSREDEVAALGVGANVKLDRAIAFVLSGAIVAVGGGLTGLRVGDVTPSLFYLEITFVIIVMIVVGGVNSLSGAVIGTLLLSAVGYALELIQSGDVLGIAHIGSRAGVENAGFAIIALVVLLLRPQGLLGAREISDIEWSAAWRRLEAAVGRGHAREAVAAGGATTEGVAEEEMAEQAGQSSRVG
jgi:branched-chain amino acid transport system permease protein